MPFFSLLSVGLGIGAATAVFTLVNALLLRPLPVADADRLVVLTTQAAARGGYTEQYAYATFDDIRRRGLVEDAIAWSTSLFTVEGEAAPASTMWVSGNLFRMLGVSPAAGRALAPEDDRPGGGPDGRVAMISHRLWQRRFGGSLDVVGRAITLDRTPVTVVGVAPPGFTGVEIGRAFDLFVPAALQPVLEGGAPLDRYAPYLWVVLRLKPEQTAGAATEALRTAQPEIRTAALPPGVLLPDFLPEPFVLESAAGGTSVFFNLRQRYRGPLAALLAVAVLVPAQRVAQIADVTPGWRDAYGIPLHRGRDFTAADAADSLPVMLVNEAFVRRFFPGEDLVGRTVTLTADLGHVSLGPKTIVGIVGDTVFASSRETPPPAIYQPLAQRSFPLVYPAYFLAIRTLASPAGIASAVTTALHDVAPDLRVTLQRMDDRVDAMLTQDRVIARLSLFAGGLALLLAAVGLYGVTAYAVACRRGELGIRLALGSTPSGLVRLIVGQVVRRVSLGVLIGGAVSLWSSRLVAPLLFGVAPHDPLVVLAAAAALVSVGVLAAWVPARAASRAIRIPSAEF